MKAAQLPIRDIHLPAEPGFWPLAPGWWVLLALALAGLAWGLWRWRQARARQARLNAVLDVLQAAEARYQKSHNAHRLAQDLSELLRRYVRHVRGDHAATSLSGQAWADYLTSLLPEPERSSDLRAQLLALENAAFNPGVSADQARQWIGAVRQLIRRSFLNPTPTEAARV